MSNSEMLDECLQNLFYAEEAMKDWIPVTEYEVLFEATISQDVKNKITQNDDTANKSVGFVRKAINAVITLISNIINSIRSFIAKFTMSGEEREAFDKFKAAMAQDPKLKNRKISVMDFRKINKAYDDLLKELEENMVAVKSNEDHPIDDITKKINTFISGTASSVTSIVGADLALKMADSNIEMAKKISQILQDESGLMKSLSNSLGKKDAVKFKKEIDAAAKNTKLHQLKVKLFRHKYDSLQDCVQGTFNAFNHLGWDTITMAKRALKNEYTGTVAKTVAKTVIKGEVELGKQKVKDKVDTAKSKVKSKVEKIIPKKQEKPQRTDGEYASATDFITGKNKKS